MDILSNQHPDDVCRVDQRLYCKKQSGQLAGSSDAKNILGFYSCNFTEQPDSSDGIKIF